MNRKRLAEMTNPAKASNKKRILVASRAHRRGRAFRADCNGNEHFKYLQQNQRAPCWRQSSDFVGGKLEYNLIMIIAALQIVLVLVGAIGAIEYMNTSPSKPKRARRRSAFVGLVLFFLVIPGAAMAQDVAKVDEKPTPKAEKALPEKVTLTDDADKIRLVQLRLMAIVNDLGKLRENIAKLEEAAKKEQTDLNAAISVAIAKFGLKPENLSDYDFKNVEPLDTGPITLVKKAPAVKSETKAKN